MLDSLKTFDLWQQGLGIPPTLPSFYWNVYSYEQRIKEICLRLERMLEYQDIQTDKINEVVDQVNKLTEDLEALTEEVARINQALLDEISAREAGDQKLETELQQEINDRIKAIQDEVTTRQEQVDKLTTDLANEATTRQEQVNTLTTNLATETTNRTNADNALDTRVTQNATQIADEVTARTNLGNSLTEALTTTNRNVSANTTAIADEASARATKDTELDEQIANLTADLPSIESDNLYTSSTKVPTVDAIRSSSIGGDVTADNPLATMNYVTTTVGQSAVSLDNVTDTDVYTDPTKIPTGTAIQNSANQTISASNKLATMADVGSGGGTTPNAIAPTSVAVNAKLVNYSDESIASDSNYNMTGIAIGSNAKARSNDLDGSIQYSNIAIGRNALAAGAFHTNSIAIGDSSSAVDSSIVLGHDIDAGSASKNVVIGNSINTNGHSQNVTIISNDPDSQTVLVKDNTVYINASDYGVFATSNNADVVISGGTYNNRANHKTSLGGAETTSQTQYRELAVGDASNGYGIITGLTTDTTLDNSGYQVANVNYVQSTATTIAKTIADGALAPYASTEGWGTGLAFGGVNASYTNIPLSVNDNGTTNKMLLWLIWVGTTTETLASGSWIIDTSPYGSYRLIGELAYMGWGYITQESSTYTVTVKCAPSNIAMRINAGSVTLNSGSTLCASVLIPVELRQ